MLKLQPKFWSDVAKNVSHPALKEALNRYKLTQELPPDAPPCAGTFTKVMGTPCAHAIKQELAGNQQVHVSDFRLHWWLQQAPVKIANALSPNKSLGEVLANVSEKYQNLALHQRPIFRILVMVEKDGVACVANPQVIRTRGRPERSVNRKTYNTTRRYPSALKYVDGQVPSPGKQICSLCRLYPHNKRRCTENAGVICTKIARVKEAKRDNAVIKTSQDFRSSFVWSSVRFEIDVEGDGNCGHCAITMCLKQSDSDWALIRARTAYRDFSKLRRVQRSI